MAEPPSVERELYPEPPDRFRAVDSRCAVDLAEFALPYTMTESRRILEEDFECSIVADQTEQLARLLIGHSEYLYAATVDQAPEGKVDCSSFVKWLFAERGIWIPRNAYEQAQVGNPIGRDFLEPGDLVFGRGSYPHATKEHPEGIGHVGIVSEAGTIIHATGPGVFETDLVTFAKGEERLRGARRIVPRPETTVTYQTPPELRIERSIDFYWLLWERKYANRPPLAKQGRWQRQM